EKDDNYAAIKVFATHQAAHIEFESFAFTWDAPGGVFEAQRQGFEQAQSRAATDMERFFDLMPDRQLANDIYTIAEDSRIDAAIKREYSGIRRSLTKVQREELERRPNVQQLPLRQGFVENLVRFSLDGPDAIAWPESRSEEMGRALGILGRLRQPEALVADTAEATLMLYMMARDIPNVVDDQLLEE
ncbi:MAG: hypothetical protein KC479_15310, partial [Dehalococcoidia bacterium]|nr:hypothetical protein [Dehalococcoidia bacterium]